MIELFSDDEDEFISKSLHVPLSRAKLSISAEEEEEEEVEAEDEEEEEFLFALLLLLLSSGIAVEDIMVIIFRGETGLLILFVTSFALCGPPINVTLRKLFFVGVVVGET